MNKPNCSTCINAGAKSDPARGFYKCKATGEFLWKTQFELICRYGCFFHHGAREWLMKDVIKELENKKDMLEGMEPDYGSENYIEAITIGKVIALIRGVKE